MYNLFGDGINDDTLAIQELLDSNKELVELPTPKAFYLISKPLKIHSNQELRLSRYCHIKLADNSSCRMLTNSDMENGNINITVSGGIWDYNNKNQALNPLIFGDFRADLYGCNPISFDGDEVTKYDGFLMYFKNVKNLTVRDLTLKDPVTFACTLDKVSYFTVDNILFDFNHGNPYPVNMDGIHLNGNCHFGKIKNLKGATYDDLVALNADEGTDGPITNIDIDGLYAESCQTFIRLLTVKNAVENIHIHNLFGTCFMYGIGITKYYKGETTGYYDGIVMDNIHIHKGEAVVDENYPRMGLENFAMITVEDETIVKSLNISNLYRNESLLATPTVKVYKTAKVENFSFENSVCENNCAEDFPMVLNDGKVETLYMKNVRHKNGEIWLGNKPENIQ